MPKQRSNIGGHTVNDIGVILVRSNETSDDRDYTLCVNPEMSKMSTKTLSSFQKRAILSFTNKLVNQINNTVWLATLYTMRTLTIQEDVINVKIFELSRFYHMLNPNSKKIVGWNVYKLFFTIYNLVVQVMLIYACMGFFFYRDYSLSTAENFVIIYAIIHIYLNVWKLSVILKNSSVIWEVFDVTKLTFFTSKLCCKNIQILHEYRDSTIQITNLFYYVIILVCSLWLVYPLAIILFISPDASKIRLPNILNFPFPVQIKTYNQYYIFFYLIESMLSCNVTCNIVLDRTFFITICWLIVAQYKVLAQSYKDIGYEDSTYKNDYEDFRSVTMDLQQLEWKLKLFHSVVRKMVLAYVAISFCLIIIITYLFIESCMSTESFSSLDVLKLGITVCSESLNLYLNCYLFDQLCSERETISFAIYSCNWTKMHIKFKKILLLTTNMVNANQPVIKASPKKIINLQFFANVMMTSYNTVSVMVKTINTENQHRY